MKKIFFTVMCIFYTRYAICITCDIHEYINNGTCTTISVGYYGTNCNLPKEYAELEYLESTGKQYIDTKIIMQPEYEIRATVNPLSTPSEGYFYWGTMPYNINLNYKSFTFWPVISSGTSRWNNKYITFFHRYLTPNALNEIIQNETGITVNETTYKYAGTYEMTEVYNSTLWIFKTNGLDSEYNEGPFRMHHFQILDADSEILINLIPALRISDCAIGMYDTVSNKFFENQGTSPFIAGPRISSCTTQTQCANAPTNSYYTESGFNNDCPWNCKEDFGQTVYDTCMPLCKSTGHKTLNAGTKISVPMFAERNTTPSLIFKFHDNNICYVDLTPGNTTDAIHVLFKGTVYHSMKKEPHKSLCEN